MCLIHEREMSALKVDVQEYLGTDIFFYQDGITW